MWEEDSPRSKGHPIRFLPQRRKEGSPGGIPHPSRSASRLHSSLISPLQPTARLVRYCTCAKSRFCIKVYKCQSVGISGEARVSFYLIGGRYGWGAKTIQAGSLPLCFMASDYPCDEWRRVTSIRVKTDPNGTCYQGCNPCYRTCHSFFRTLHIPFI